jgi:hypothetical protein
LRERQFPVVEFGADTEVAVRARQQFSLEPRLVFGDRRTSGLDRCRKPLPGFRRQLLHYRDDHRVDDRLETTVLLNGGLGMDFRHALGLQRFPCLFEKAWELRQARCHIVETLFDWCEIAGQKSVDGVARQAHIVEWIPRPFLEPVELEQRGLYPVMQDRGVDLIGARQFVTIDGGQRFAVLEKSVCCLRPRGRVYVIETVIRPMITQCRGGDGRTFGDFVKVSVCELRK